MRIDRAVREDLPALGRLKWQDVPADLTAGRSLDTFIAELGEWWQAHAHTHVAFVARTEDDDRVVGAAWVALVPRVPRPGAPDRISADIQSVFVVPEHRRRGAGRGLVAAACAHAVSVGAERITVHSSEAAVGLYRELGFADSPRLRQFLAPATATPESA
ncbi:GNAT family N-acetyltransferase [Zhihengliuella sp. ISTPL4]|uniref:GNAT family N-acetyltransferase n=1 Tax=Zhihengliuella sp. ISTPL4 TaxID=2058657 RepID=UPI000C7E1CB2|nr:GNAT family N-acetyltransferase [Zhihengliuella sp. ISTPL4]